MYEGMLAETVRVRGHNGDEIDGYFARPLGAGPFPGVVLIHHMPGWDEGSKEMVRKFAYHGYACISPNLHYREGPGDLDDVVAAVRGAGEVPDDRFVGDFEGAMTCLRSLPYHSGKIGAIGFCSGGRHAYIAACRVPGLDAAVDCWGGRVIMSPDGLTERQAGRTHRHDRGYAMPPVGHLRCGGRFPLSGGGSSDGAGAQALQQDLRVPHV